MRVAVLFNDDLGLSGPEARDPEAVQGVREARDAVLAALRALGHQAEAVAVGADPEASLLALRAFDPEVAFNLVESIGGRARLEAAFAWLLEWLQIPFTGSAPEVLSLALDKGVAKAVLAQAGLPVPAGVIISTGKESFAHLHAPWIVKPLRQDASHGIDAESVTSDPERARARATELRARFEEPVLLEELIEGRELNVSILQSGAGTEVLPPGEIDFSRFPAGSPRILTYAAKWREDSVEYITSPAIAARDLSPGLEAELAGRAAAAVHALGIRGYGRVDFRVDAVRGPVVLEVNPNPDLSPKAGFARAAARKGLSYEQLVARILDAALET